MQQGDQVMHRLWPACRYGRNDNIPALETRSGRSAGKFRITDGVAGGSFNAYAECETRVAPNAPMRRVAVSGSEK